MSSRKIKVCANCHGTYIEGDKYCRYCGAPMGKPVYIQDFFAAIYGPRPMNRVHKCSKCGYSWTTILMVDKERHCPKCGGEAPVTEKSFFEIDQNVSEEPDVLDDFIG